jgi:hypothetical protein
MNLRECLEDGWICGLETVGESINNILLHSINLFDYPDIAKEDSELLDDFVNSKLTDNDFIKDVLLERYNIKTEDIDERLRLDLERLDNRNDLLSEEIK